MAGSDHEGASTYAPFGALRGPRAEVASLPRCPPIWALRFSVYEHHRV